MEREVQNPYRWSGTDIEVHINRTKLLADVRRELLSGGGSAYLLGAMGMGKSVFLKDLMESLRSEQGPQAILFATAPGKGTLEALQSDLIDKLVRTCPEGLNRLRDDLDDLRAHLDPRMVIDTYLGARTDLRALLLLYDELDDYADKSGNGRQWFKILESIRKDNSSRLKIFAAGGLRLFQVGDSLASPFLSRARRFLLAPFGKDDLHELAKPLLERGDDKLLNTMLDQVLMASGGNGALMAYGLHELWEGEQDVVEIYERFKEQHHDFLRRFHEHAADQRVSKLPSLFWGEILRGGGLLRQDNAERLIAEDGDDLSMDVRDVIDLLQSAGLVQLDSSIHEDPILLRVIPSILNFEPRAARRPRARLRDLLVDDLREILGLLHSMTLDFFRQGELVPEDLLSAFIASNLRSRGWTGAEREAILGAGHADIKATHGRFPHMSAIVEVKIWPRNHEGIHEQVARYWTSDVEAGAAVMFDMREDVSQWRSEYERDCLEGKAHWDWEKPRIPLHGHVVATSSLPSNVSIKVDHFLLHLQRAPNSRHRKARKAGSRPKRKA